MVDFEQRSFEFRKLLGRDMESYRYNKVGPEMPQRLRGPISRVTCQYSATTPTWVFRASWLAEEVDGRDYCVKQLMRNQNPPFSMPFLLIFNSLKSQMVG